MSRDKLKILSDKRLVKMIFVISASFVVIFLIIFWSSPNHRPFALKRDGVLERKVLPKTEESAEIKPVRHADQTDRITGIKGGPVEMIVYVDFDCPFSSRYFSVIKSVVNKYGNNVTVVWRNYPLESHQMAMDAAMAFECAANQDKAMEMAGKLFNLYDINANTKEAMTKSAIELGLNLDRFNLCLSDESLRQRILDQKEEAKSFGVNGAPTTFLNGRNLPGAWQFDDFTDSGGYKHQGLATIIDNLLKKR